MEMELELRHVHVGVHECQEGNNSSHDKLWLLVSKQCVRSVAMAVRPTGVGLVSVAPGYGSASSIAV
jgi:hypothetical protein